MKRDRTGEYQKHAEAYRIYNRKFEYHRYMKYIKVCICPKCGKRGYARAMTHENVNGKSLRSQIRLIVNHRHKVAGKWKWHYSCYLNSALVPSLVLD